MKKFFLFPFLLLFVFFTISPIFSDEDYDSLFDDFENNETTVDEEDNDTTPDVENKNSLSGETYVFLAVPLNPDYMDFSGMKAPGLFNDINLLINSNTVKVISNWSLEMIMNETGEINKIITIFPKENYITWHPKVFSFSAGYQIFNWGTADALNPTDNLNPFDYTKGFESEKIPLLSFNATSHITDRVSLELIYVPFEQNDILPVDPVTLLEEQFPSSTVNIEKENFDPSSFLAGSRLDFYLSFMDFSLSYLYNLDPFYTADITMGAHDLSEIEPVPPGMYTYYAPDIIDLERKRIHQIGLDWKFNINRFGFWGEGCYGLTEDYAFDKDSIRNPKLSWILGLDFFYGPNEIFYLNFQYGGEYIYLFDKSYSNDYGSDFPDLEQISDPDIMEEFYYRSINYKLDGTSAGLTQAFMIKADCNLLDDSLIPSLTSIYFFPLEYDTDAAIRYGSLYLNPEIRYHPADSFDIILGSKLFYAWEKEADSDKIIIDKDDKVGQYNKDNQIYIKIDYAWKY